jgi:hypothetical protein
MYTARMLRCILCFVCCSLLMCASATATVVLPIDFRELTTSASVIVHGRVVDVRAEWVDGRRAVETFVTIEADEYLKGGLGERVTFKVPGGQLGRYRTVFVGAPSFEAGDEVVLFLKSNGPSFPFVIGLTQGVFRVTSDARSGGRVVTPPALLGKTASGSEPIVRGDPARRPVAIDAFRDIVRQVLSEAGQGGQR